MSANRYSPVSIIVWLIGAFLLILPATSPAHAEIGLRIITPAGWVGFVAEDHWPVIATQTKFPVAVMAFQIPNTADQGTPDSTNLAISLIEIADKSQQAVSARAKIGRRIGDNNPIVDQVGDWKTYTQAAKQGDTTYFVVDATKNVADVQVSVRLAWPEIGPDPDQYRVGMNSLLDKFLRSVNGELGKYKPRPGEVTRRPVAQP